MQQAADPTPLVVQAQCKGAVQFGDQEHGFGRDMVSVRRDHDFRKISCQCGPLVDSQMLHATVDSLCQANHGFAKATRRARIGEGIGQRVAQDETS
jgi:hypothetical protein